MQSAPSNKLPLCVDLDGTLIYSDLLLESLIQTLRKQPWRILQVPFWLLAGRAVLKQRLAELGPVSPGLLPYNEEFVDWLRWEHAASRQLILATASDRQAAETVASHVGLFSEVIANDGVNNLKGEEKLAALRKRFPQGFAYAGDSAADLPVWQGCQEAIVVNASTAVTDKARKQGNVVGEFGGSRVSFMTLSKALRVHQWSKNLLILLPPLLSHRFLEPQIFLGSLIAFFAFCLAASGIYVINDLGDLPEDRQHPSKRSRPLASGRMPIAWALLMAPLLIAGGLAVAALFSAKVAALMILYLAINALYSFSLKGRVLMDVFVLAGLYTLRLIVGYVASGVAFSAWLLSFSIFFFLSLAFAKRVSELHRLREKGGTAPAGRGYRVSDLSQISMFGIAAGFASILVLTLYFDSQKSRELYPQQSMLWLIFPLILYWVTRIWLIAGRGELDEDPVVFAIRDRVSYVVALLTFLLGMLASSPVFDGLLG